MLIEARRLAWPLRFPASRAGRATIYIDPYRVAAGAPKADLILVTHGHYDHFSPQDIERLSQKGTWLVAPAAVAERVSGQVLSIAPGECSRTSWCAAWR